MKSFEILICVIFVMIIKISDGFILDLQKEKHEIHKRDTFDDITQVFVVGAGEIVKVFQQGVGYHDKFDREINVFGTKINGGSDIHTGFGEAGRRRRRFVVTKESEEVEDVPVIDERSVDSEDIERDEIEIGQREKRENSVDEKTPNSYIGHAPKKPYVPEQTPSEPGMFGRFFHGIVESVQSITSQFITGVHDFFRQPMTLPSNAN